MGSHPWRDAWVGPIDWKEAAEAFDNALVEWSQQPPRAGCAQVCVGLFGSADQLVRAWADAQGAILLEPPTTNQLLEGSTDAWPSLLNAHDGLVVIPALERCFLRHHLGLRLVRQIIATVWEKPSRLVIGCDIWAWRFLQKAAQVDTICHDPLICASLDATAIQSWLSSLTSDDNGIRLVIDGTEGLSLDSTGVNGLFRELAFVSSGVPTLAHELWRSMLKTCPRELSGNEVVFNLTKFAELPFSSVKPPDTRLSLYILHVILLHAGLPANALTKMLPFGATQVLQGLSELRHQNRVIEDHGRWQVAAQSYSEVRRRLADAGFWVSEV